MQPSSTRNDQQSFSEQTEMMRIRIPSLVAPAVWCLYVLQSSSISIWSVIGPRIRRGGFFLFSCSVDPRELSTDGNC
jgi:hypothetical protein